MQTIHTIEEANQVLARYVPLAKVIIAKDITLDRMWPLLDLVGNPQQKLKVVHIAGTSGKTSTAYFIAALIRESGKSVGLSVSPHIDTITERIQVDGRPISNADFCAYLNEFLELMGDYQPTYFELLIAFAYWVFAKVGVDYAVMETGLGGLHDSTNVATRSDKVCVITDIGFDHMQVLGNTLAAIAAQKAGIIQENNQVFMFLQSTEVMKPIVDRCASRGAVLNTVRTKVHAELSHMPLFQQHNWTLSRAVYEYLSLRDELPILNEDQIRSSQVIQVPGRMDTSLLGDKTLIMDGAHNQQKMHAFVSSFQSRYPGQKASILVSLKSGKEHPGVLDELIPITNQLIITTFKNAQDMQSKSMDPVIIGDYCDEKGFENYKIISNQQEAYGSLLKSKDKLLIITGSFYLISQIRSRTEKS